MTDATEGHPSYIDIYAKKNIYPAVYIFFTVSSDRFTIYTGTVPVNGHCERSVKIIYY